MPIWEACHFRLIVNVMYAGIPSEEFLALELNEPNCTVVQEELYFNNY